jgi:hypothetical protein
LAGQHRHDVDVVLAVADGDPADRVVVLPAGCEAGAVHDVTGDLRPLIIGQHLVLGGGADRAMPDRAFEAARPERGVRLLEKAVEVAEVAVAVGEEKWFQFGEVAPSGNEVRVGVLLAAAGAEEVVDPPADTLPARIADLPDHRSRFRISSAAASSCSARRMLSMAYGRSPPEC